MKKIAGIVGTAALIFSLSTTAFSQETTQTGDTSKMEATWDAKKNPTVDSITSRFKEKYIAPKPALTQADIFPVIGEYEASAGSEAGSLNISLDPQNKGLVWIEGLPQGRVKAMLRKSPATYKIPAQQTEDGKEVAEGTLIFDAETNTLNICLGKAYNTTDPASAFAPATDEESNSTVKKTKAGKTTVPKTWMYTGTKIEKQEKETVMN